MANGMKSRKSQGLGLIIAWTCTGLLCFGAPDSHTQTNFLPPHARPSVQITNAVFFDGATPSLQLTFELAAVGKTPIALAQEQFTATISKSRWSFDGELALPGRASKILTANPGKPELVKAIVTVENSEAQSDRRLKLSPGRYTVQLFFGSGRRRRFDYQYLGVGHSNSFEFEVK